VVRPEREFFIDNLMVRIHFIIVMMRWTGLAPWEFEFSFPGSLTSAYLKSGRGTPGSSHLRHEPRPTDVKAVPPPLHAVFSQVCVGVCVGVCAGGCVGVCVGVPTSA